MTDAPPLPAPPSAPAHVWANAYGGAGSGPNPPAIHGVLLALRKSVGAIAATRGAAPYPVKNAKELMNKLAAACHEHGAVVSVTAVEVTPIDVSTIPAMPNPKDQPRSACLVRCTVRFIAPDGSYLDAVGIGHGMSNDDKAAGKGSTYAWKDAVLKGLSIGDKEMVDTDDEAQGEAAPARRTALKAPAPPAAQTTAAEVARYKALILAAKSVPELQAVGDQIKATLGMDGAMALTPEYRARLTTLASAGLE